MTTPDGNGLSLEELAGDIATLYEQIRTHADRLRSLRQAVHAIDARLGELLVAHPPNARVFRWEDLSEPDREAKHDALSGWVTAITDCYRYDEIPGCPRWADHPALVEELTALWLAWTGAYTPAAHPAEPLRWHEALHRARDRLSDLRGGCTATEHHPPGGPPPLPEGTLP